DLYGDKDIRPFQEKEKMRVMDRALKKSSDFLMLTINEVCNLNCLFCSAKGRKKDTDLASAQSLLNQARKGLIISGGEPTLSKDLFETIEEAKKRGLTVELQTNGTNLYYDNLTEQLVRAGVDLFNVNFPSHKNSVHDRLTQTKGMLPLKIAGLKNLRSLKAKIRLTHIINGLNYRELEGFVDFVSKNFPDIKYIQFSFLKIMGAARKHPEIIISYERSSPFLLKALKKCIQNKINFIVDHIPACYLGSYKQYHIDYQKTDELNNNSDSSYSTFEKIKLEACQRCSFESRCYGVRKDYLEYFGKKTIVKPIK
ncbi:MAG: radical SAM protein, partial [Parcubacteria group bacterium]